MMPARRARSVWRAYRANWAPWLRSVGQTRNTNGLTPDRSGLEAEGEIIATGRRPAPYTRPAARDVPDVRWPTTATTAGSSANAWATRIAISARPLSSTMPSSSGRPRTPPRALISFTASSAARCIETPRGCENGPARPTTIGRVPSREHDASPRLAIRASLRRGCIGWRITYRLSTLVGMDATHRLCAFAAGLERLLGARDACQLDATWDAMELTQSGWEALALARRANTEALEPALAQVDRRLLAVLERCRAFLDPHIVTFRVPELERWQHAAAAALVGARWGVAGLRTVIADTQAPLGRRYYAFLALAERHPIEAWPLFAKYLQTPGAHHAFVAAAVEAARYYPGQAANVIALFQRIRGDEMLRRFLAPKILESLYVLGDPAALPLFEELLVAGHTDPDAGRCEVTRALVAVRKLTGRVAASSKFPDPEEPDVIRALDEAQRIFEAEKDRLEPVVVI